MVSLSGRFHNGYRIYRISRSVRETPSVGWSTMWTAVRVTRIAVAVLLAVAGAACGSPDPVPDPGGGLDADATVLRDRELVVSVSPSGGRLLTTNDDHRLEADELVSDLCVRSGDAFERVECVAVPADSVSSVSWSPNEDRVAFTHTGSQRRGERNDVVRVLDIADMRVRAVSPVGLWLPGSSHAAWTPAGALVYVQPRASRSYLVHTAEGQVTGAPRIDPVPTDVDLPVAVDGLDVTGLDIDAAGLIVTGTTEAGRTVTQRWTGSDPRPRDLVPGVGATYMSVAVDPERGRVISRFLDTHHSPPPEIADLQGRTSTIPTPDGTTILTVDFGAGGDELSALVRGADAASVAVYAIGSDLTVTERSVTPIADLPDRRSFPFVARTDRGVVVEGRTDGLPGRVYIMEVSTGR